MYFGEYIKHLRIARRITLRDFCRQAGMDPSNWSKVERGILSAPKSNEVLSEIAGVLGLESNTEEWHKLFDLAITAHIPSDLLGSADIADKLPIFFRTLRGDKPSKDELLNLIEKIKNS